MLSFSQKNSIFRLSLAVAMVFLFSSCGSGGGSSAPAPAPTSGTTSQYGDPTSDPDGTRTAAVQQTISGNTLCSSIEPFYYEVGNSSGQVTAIHATGNGQTAINENSLMILASSSKLIARVYAFQKYVAAAQSGNSLSQLLARFNNPNDFLVQVLNFTSPYTNMPTGGGGCTSSQTVATCFTSSGHDTSSGITSPQFYYDPGHLQCLFNPANCWPTSGSPITPAFDLGSYTVGQLATEVKSVVTDLPSLIYSSPDLAGGGDAKPIEMSALLRGLMNGNYSMTNQALVSASSFQNSLIGYDAVCTDPTVSGCNAISSPVTQSIIGQSWHMTIGAWLENDPSIKIPVYSWPGAYGFYPAISTDGKVYLLLARSVSNGYIASVQCGQILRQAWYTKTPVL